MEEEEIKEVERLEEESAKERDEELRDRDSRWERGKYAGRVRAEVSSMETGKRGLQEGSNPKNSKRRKKERKYALLSGWGEDEEQWKTTELEAKTTWNPGGQENHQVDSVVEVGDIRLKSENNSGCQDGDYMKFSESDQR